MELAVRERPRGAAGRGGAWGEIRGRRASPPATILFVGDDLNDVPAFRAAGVRVAVADAALEVQALAHWVTRAAGGRGAIREVIETVLRAQGRWEEGVERYYQQLEQEHERGGGAEHRAAGVAPP